MIHLQTSGYVAESCNYSTWAILEISLKNSNWHKTQSKSHSWASLHCVPAGERCLNVLGLSCSKLCRRGRRSRSYSSTSLQNSQRTSSSEEESDSASLYSKYCGSIAKHTPLYHCVENIIVSICKFGYKDNTELDLFIYLFVSITHGAF